MNVNQELRWFKPGTITTDNNSIVFKECESSFNWDSGNKRSSLDFVKKDKSVIIASFAHDNA
jgi:hypothetical protein